MKGASLIAACCAILGGCAADCGPDWFSVGARDGRLGVESQVDNYAGRCSGPVDRVRYEEGRQAGLAMRPRTPYP
jgi:hypothetical protein